MQNEIASFESVMGYCFAWVSTSSDAAALDETNQDHDHGGHKENVNEASHSVRGEESKCPEHEKDDGDCPKHGRVLLGNHVGRLWCGLHPRRVPQHVRDGLRGQARDLARIGAVLRGLVEDGQDQLTERDLLNLGSHVLAFLGTRIPVQQNPGHQLVGNENGNLDYKRVIDLASSIKAMYVSHQIEGG